MKEEGRESEPPVAAILVADSVCSFFSHVACPKPAQLLNQRPLDSPGRRAGGAYYLHHLHRPRYTVLLHAVFPLSGSIPACSLCSVYVPSITHYPA